MSATVISSLTQTAEPAVRPRRSRYLYVGLGVVMTLIIFGGFTRTYWVRILDGTIDMHPAIHVHAMVAFMWTLLYTTQAVLAARGRIALHRELGLLGIVLATAMVMSGVLASIVGIQLGIGGPREPIVRANAALSAGAMIMFTTFMALAIANIRVPERHKRFATLAMFAIVQAAVSRIIMLVPSIDHPLRLLLGAIIVDVILLTVIVIDTRARGRIHPVYLGGAAFILLLQYVRRAIVETDGWRIFIDWVAVLGT